MSKIVELKAGEIQNVVGGVGMNAPVNTAGARPTYAGHLNASTAYTSSFNVSAATFQMPSPGTAHPLPRR
jgi:hypothetical protein